MQRARTFVQTSTEQLRRHSGFLLRVSLAVVFIWFGALKVAGASPVDRLVLDALPLVNGRWFLPLLGVFEVGIGAALLQRARPVVVTALVLHLAGTFLVLVTRPELAFQSGNPLLLTTEGEFVVKNIVLLAAALVTYGQTGPESSTPSASPPDLPGRVRETQSG